MRKNEFFSSWIEFKTSFAVVSYAEFFGASGSVFDSTYFVASPSKNSQMLRRRPRPDESNFSL